MYYSNIPALCFEMGLKPYRIRLYLYLLSWLHTLPLLYLGPVYAQDQAHKQHPVADGVARPEL